MSLSNTPGKMLLRNLAALLYDLLILPAIWFIAALPTVLIQDGTPFQQGWPRVLLQAWLLLVTFIFLGLSWVRGGQTIGMRAWRIRLVSADAQPVRWSQAGRRFAAGVLNVFLAGLIAYSLLGATSPLLTGTLAGALACLGFLSLLRPPHRSLFDWLSGTRLVFAPRKQKPNREPAQTDG